ncbi:MAG: hypothetical protein WAU02_01640 [Candidatus Saccharimonadales bacterium]
MEQAQSPYKQSNVSYLNGATTFQKTPAILEWAADNRIRLFAQNPAAGKYDVVFDCAPTDIAKFTPAIGTATIVMRSGQRFVVEFDAGVRNDAVAGAILGNFGLIGMVVGLFRDKSAKQKEEATDIMWWRDSLTRFGVGGAYFKTGYLYTISKWGAIVVISLIALSLILAAVRP